MKVTRKLVEPHRARPDAAIALGDFAELFTWAAALPDAAREHLTARGFEPVDLQARSHGCPCVLVKAVSPAHDSEPWVLGDRRLTDPRVWDLRMIYTMAG